MKKTICAASLLMLLTGAAFSQTIYKCGKVLQQTPCKDGEQEIVKTWGVPKDRKSRHWDLEKEGLDPEFAERTRQAIAKEKVFIGMRRIDVERSWGEPTKINTSIGSYGKHEQWVYRHGSGSTDYVYIENGFVRSIQSSN